MTRRLPLFAAVWLGVAVGWLVVLCVEALLAPLLAVPILAVQAGVVGGAIALARAELAVPRVLGVVMVACVFLGTSTIVVFAAVHGSGDFLAYVLLTLYLSAALAFMWGWRAELLLLVATVIPWLLALHALRFHFPTPELLTAIVTGSVLCLAIAEAGARNLEAALRHQASEERSRHALEASRNAAERARAEAEAATLARDRFLAVLSHELRSPLSSVLTWTGMLRRGLVSGERVPKALASIEAAARAQVRLVEDLLDVSRIAAGKVSLQLETVDLAAILGARAEVARAAAAAKGITLEVRLAAPPDAVRGDPARLSQVFENLLSNAIKFTPEGGHVRLALERADGQALVTVSDTGIGIPAQVLPHVFEAFQQADSSITRRYGGLGLGLSIVRRLIEMHGGSIETESAGEDRGATFRVRLPLAPRPAAAEGAALPANAARAPVPQLDHVRVLVVDDEPQAREVLTALLAACGAEVGSAASVREALEQVETKTPDVLLADIAMPDEDGYALIRKIRSRAPRIPAIAITALAGAADRARAMAEGYDAHLTKPVDPAEVVEAVARRVAATALARSRAHPA
jgi:signal transduction histidine kinase/ActR/RegA family two-component response regulator